MIRIATILLATALAVLAQQPRKLTLGEAEALAVKNHPRVAVALIEALASNQVTLQVRSALYPQIAAAVTGAGSWSESRLSAGAINNPIILDRAAAGFGVSQLLTDFGRTASLIDAQRLRARARDEFVTATRAEILLQVDRAYFAALRASAVVRVAEQTVAARQLIADQVAALTRASLRSGLDLSFAQVNLSEAKLLLARANNERDAEFADLAAAIGQPQAEPFDLSDEPMPGLLDSDSAAAIAEALKSRPELAVLRTETESARRFAEAEQRLARPVLSAQAAAGGAPVREDRLTSRYTAAAVTLTIPVFNGGLFGARRAEADLRAQAAAQHIRDAEQKISRDVRVAWLNAQNAFERLALTGELLAQATQSLDLAQARYDLGLSSIVELSQAQLNRTAADIAQASSRFDYQIQRAVLRYQTGAMR